jgi:hypothetical protein
VLSHRATAGPARRRAGSAPALTVPTMLTALALLLGATACSDGSPDGTATAVRTAVPNPSPSVWTTSGSPAAAATATGALLRVGDLPTGYSAAPLTVPAVKAMKPPACRALWGPGLGLLDGSTGRASTAFVGVNLTAIAHSVGVYPTQSAAAAAVGRARQLGRACARTVADGVTFSVTSADSPGAGGAPGVTLVLTQSRGVGETTVTVRDRMVSVLVIAGRPPGPGPTLVQQASVAAGRRLTTAGIAAENAAATATATRPAATATATRPAASATASPTP